MTYDAPTEDIEIYPNAVVNVNGQQVEVDAYLPQFSVGVECKIFEDALAPLTKSRLASIVSGLSRQAERLSSTGIENVVVVTNLPDESANRLKAELQKSIQQKSVGIKGLEVVQGDADALIQMLDRLSGGIAQKVSEKLSKIVEKAALKSQAPELAESPQSSEQIGEKAPEDKESAVRRG